MSIIPDLAVYLDAALAESGYSVLWPGPILDEPECSDPTPSIERLLDMRTEIETWDEMDQRVLLGLVEESTQEEIADELGVNQATVSRHLQTIQTRLGGEFQ